MCIGKIDLFPSCFVYQTFLRRINWVNHNLTCAGCQDPANELHVLSIGCKRRKQWLDNNNGSASIKQTMGGEDCNFCCDLNKFLYDVVEL